MASFTVDAISSSKQKETSQMMADSSQETMSKLLQRSSVRQAEMGTKRNMQMQDRVLKMAEQRQCRILQMKVERRFQAFPFLREKIPPLASKPSLPELQETDELQKLELNLQGAEKRLRGYLSRGSTMLEAIWGDGSQLTFLPEQMRFNLTGYGALMNSKAFLKEAEPLITETVIEYPEFGQLGLGARWAECILSSMLIVHQSNTNPAFKALLAKGKIPESELEEEEEEQEGNSASDEDVAAAK